MDERKLEFTIFCIESLSESLGMDGKKVYKLIKDANVLDGYIIS